MPEVPETCRTCGTGVPSGASKCPGCGRVFGEENRCPHCHAIAPIRVSGGKTVCAACSKPRVGAVDMRGRRRSAVPTSHSARQTSTSAMMVRARGRTQRGFGVFTLAGGIAAAALAAVFIPGALGLGLAALGGAFAVGVGGLSIRAGARNMDRARGLNQEAEQMAIHELAKKHGGVLEVREVAAHLQVSDEQADDILTSMVGDGTEVDLEIDNDGVVTYVFHDLQAAAKVRVDLAEEEPKSIDVQAIEAERSDKRHEA